MVHKIFSEHFPSLMTSIMLALGGIRIFVTRCKPLKTFTFKATPCTMYRFGELLGSTVIVTNLSIYTLQTPVLSFQGIN